MVVIFSLVLSFRKTSDFMALNPFWESVSVISKYLFISIKIIWEPVTLNSLSKFPKYSSLPPVVLEPCT